jgi:hypothetical protein
MVFGFIVWLMVHGAHQRIEKLTKRIEQLEADKKPPI